jgi:hypothetical protein
MKANVYLAALCFLIFYCSAAYGQPPKKNDRSAEWEYKLLSTNNPSDELLNHYAKDGWEIAATPGGDSYFKVILKRSKSHPLFGTQTSELPKPEPLPTPQKPTCKLTLAQAPVIRGLRLGMASDELFAIFPGNEREEFNRAQQLKSAELPPHYGFTYFEFNLSNYATRDRFTGISSLSFELFDKKVVSIRVNYSNAPSFDRPGQLMEIITRQFSLPELKDWPGYNEYSNNPSLSCDGFTFKVDANNAYYSVFSIMLTDPTYKKIAEDRKQADRAKKREGFKL